MNAVIYARYSSHGQNETSIEGQVKAIYEYAKSNGYEIVHEYIDRAKTGTNSKRPQYVKMLEDAANQKFDYIIVYTLDRFSRDRYESAIHKSHLKKNGIRVLSVTETISDDPAGIMVEGLFEAMAEFYSAELSQKVRRGIVISIENTKHIGGVLPLGYTADAEKNYQIDSLTAPIIPRVFELYVSGLSLKEIANIIKAEFGKEFKNPFNSVGHILDNVNYIGTYTRGGNIVENAIPRLVSDELFYQAQERRAKQKKTPASARAYEDYILTTKLFCGYDREMMVGTGGTGKSGKAFHYYGCKNVIRKKGCKKKNVRKSYIEDFVVAEARKQLDQNIDLIVQAVCEASKRENNAPHIAEIKQNIKDNAKAIENILIAVESGENIEIYNERLTQRKKERTALESALAKAQMETVELDENEIKFFFRQLQKGDIDDERTRKALIAIFVNSVYLYDDKIRIIFNATDRPITVDYGLLDDIERLENGDPPTSGRCSYMKDTAPPRISQAHTEKKMWA